MRRAVENIEESLPSGARIAITPMVGNYMIEFEYNFHYHFTLSRGPVEEFLTNELELILLSRNFTVVTTGLDEIHVAERRYWGLESDTSVATRIGRFAGATVVIIVGVDGPSNFRRLRLRVVNTATMQVIGAASESF